MEKQINSLITFNSVIDSKNIEIKYELVFNMIDGKVKNAITHTESSMRCLWNGFFTLHTNAVKTQCLQNVGFFGPHHVPIWEKHMQTWRVSVSALLHAAVTSFV